MDTLQAARVFIRVVEAASFTRAAEKLSLPKTSVSAIIGRLELLLGVKLLSRTTRSLKLTDDGLTYYKKVRELVESFDELELSVSKRASSPGGLLRVDMHVSIGRHLVIPALSTFVSQHPEINLELGLTERIVNLTEEGFDIKLHIGEAKPPSLVARELAIMKLVTCAAPSYLQRFSPPKRIEDLSQHRCAVYRLSSGGRILPWQFQQTDKPVFVIPDHTIAVNQIDGLLDVAAAGMAIIRVGLLEARAHLADGRLVRIMKKFDCDGPKIYAIYPPVRFQPYRVRVFLEWINGVFKAESKRI